MAWGDCVDSWKKFYDDEADFMKDLKESWFFDDKIIDWKEVKETVDESKEEIISKISK